MTGGEQSMGIYTTATSGVEVNVLKEVYGMLLEQSQIRTATKDLLDKSKRSFSGKYWKTAEHFEGAGGAVNYRSPGVELPPPRNETYSNGLIYDRYLYASIAMDGPFMAHARGNSAAFVDGITSEVKAKTNWAIDKQNRLWYGDGWGVFATVSSRTDANTLVVTTPCGRWLRKGERFDVWTSTWKTATTPVKVPVATTTRLGHTIASVTDNGDGTFTITTDTATSLDAAVASTNVLVYEDIMGAAGTTVAGGNSRESDVVGGEGGALTGLDVMVDDSTVAYSYQSIDRRSATGFTEYRGNVLTNGGSGNRALTLDLLQKGENLALTNGGKKPSTWMSGQGQERNLIALGLPDVRHVAENLKLGFTELTFNGHKWFVDPVCQDNRIYGLSPEENIFRYEAVPWGPLSADGSPVTSRRAGFDIYDKSFAEYANIGCDHPNRNLKITELSEPA